MIDKKLHNDIEEHLKHYYLNIDFFNPIDTEFRAFEVFNTRVFLQDHQEQMNKAELTMLVIVDKMAIQTYNDLKYGLFSEYGTVEELLQIEDVQDLQKVVLIAMKNYQNNSFIHLADKVQKLYKADLIFNSCIVETLIE